MLEGDSAVWPTFTELVEVVVIESVLDNCALLIPGTEYEIEDADDVEKEVEDVLRIVLVVSAEGMIDEMVDEELRQAIEVVLEEVDDAVDNSELELVL